MQLSLLIVEPKVNRLKEKSKTRLVEQLRNSIMTFLAQNHIIATVIRGFRAFISK